MRTTLDIGDDVLAAAKELARRGKTTAGTVIPGLARKGLAAPESLSVGKEAKALDGFRALPKRGGIVTNQLIGKLRDDDIY